MIRVRLQSYLPLTLVLLWHLLRVDRVGKGAIDEALCGLPDDLLHLRIAKERRPAVHALWCWHLDVWI